MIDCATIGTDVLPSLLARFSGLEELDLKSAELNQPVGVLVPIVLRRSPRAISSDQSAPPD